MGFAVGNKTLISALTRVKSYLDYGAFTPIQAAAVAAINGPQDIVEKNRELYKKRRDVMVESFARAGWEIPSPRASMFCWAPLPPAVAHLGSLEFSKQLLTHAGVAVAPGVGYGEDLNRARGALADMAAAHAKVLADPHPWTGVTGLLDSAVQITLHAWVEVGDWWQTQADLMQGGKEALDAAGIEIPFPHQVAVPYGDEDVMPVVRVRTVEDDKSDLTTKKS